MNSAELVFMFALATPRLTELDEHFTHRCQEQIASPLTKSPIGVLEVLSCRDQDDQVHSPLLRTKVTIMPKLVETIPAAVFGH